MAYRAKPKLQPKSRPAPKVDEARPSAPWSPPACAIPVWLGPDGDLMIGLPPRAGEAGHSVRVTSKRPEVMASVLLRVLSDRAAAPFARISEPGVPTQALTSALESALAQGKRVIHAELRLDNLEDSDFLA